MNLNSIFAKNEETEGSKSDLLDLEMLSYVSTQHGICCTLSSSFYVSHQGHWVIGLRANKTCDYTILKQTFNNEQALIIEPKKKIITDSILISEHRNLGVCGIEDEKVMVFNLQNGEELKTIPLRIGDVDSFLKLGDLGVIGGRRMIRFLDLKSLEVVSLEMKDQIACKYVLSMKDVSVDVNGVNYEIVYVGGTNTSNITKVGIPEGVRNLSKWIVINSYCKQGIGCEVG